MRVIRWVIFLGNLLRAMTLAICICSAVRFMFYGVGA